MESTEAAYGIANTVHALIKCIFLYIEFFEHEMHHWTSSLLFKRRKLLEGEEGEAALAERKAGHCFDLDTSSQKPIACGFQDAGFRPNAIHRTIVSATTIVVSGDNMAYLQGVLLVVLFIRPRRG